MSAVHRLGRAGENQIFVQGAIASDEPIGSEIQIDFYATADSAAANQRTFVGSTVVTKRGAGPVSFGSVIEADIEMGQGLVAAIGNRSDSGLRFSVPKMIGESPDEDSDGIQNGVEVLAPNFGDGNRDGIRDSLQEDVASFPARMNGRFVTLDGMGHRLGRVQVLESPADRPRGVSFPYGMIGFELSDVVPGSVATVQLTLPSEVPVDTYFKLDSTSGALVPFDFDGTTGARITSNRVTLYLQDGGRGDADGLANGVIVDPGEPGATGMITVPCGGANGVGGWTVVESGGSGTGRGSVTLENNHLVLREGNSFLVAIERELVLPANPTTLTFSYTELGFDTIAQGFHNDAFEGALVDTTGLPIVPIFHPDRDAYINFTEGEPVAEGSKTSIVGQTINLDISGVLPQGAAKQIFRLVNNDDDENSLVRIRCQDTPSPSVATIQLTSDTAPADVPAGHPFRSDVLTNDSRVNGTASDDVSVTKLEIQVDSGAFQDITTSLVNGQWSFDPGTIAYGAHHLTVRATDTTNLTSTAVLDFMVNQPPVSNPGPDQTIGEGSTVAFDGSGSTDAEGAIYAYRWTLDNNTTVDVVTASRQYPQDGVFTSSLTVTDTAGSVVTDPIVITVLNLAPIVAAIANKTASEGDTVPFSSTFTDSGVLDTHTGTINWGDGSAVQSASIVESSGSGTVSGSHLYKDNGVYTVTVTVTDDGGLSGSTTFTVTSSNVAPTVTADDLTGNEGQSRDFSATFTDSGVLDTHTAIVYWSDGSSTAGTVSESNGSGTVTGSHTYADNRVYPIRVDVTDNAGGAGSKTVNGTIANVPPTVMAAANQTTNEGTSLSLTVATFSDPGFTNATAGTEETFTASINWGDGTTTAGTVSVTQGSVGVLTSGSVAGSHTYADNGTYTVTVTATDDDLGSGSASFTVTVNNVSPSVTPAANQNANEGETLSLQVASFTDPGFTRATAGTQETFTATINWGDGTPVASGTVSVNQGSPGVLTQGSVTGSHAYLNNGTFTVTVTVTDDDNGTNSVAFTVTVNNVAPNVLTAGDLTGDEGQSLDFSATYSDPGALDTHTATVYWGDGTSSVGTVSESSGSGSVTANHIYADNGTYGITVEVVDNDGNKGTRSATGTILNIAPSVTAAANQTINEGSLLDLSGAVKVATFTDPGFTRASAGTVEMITATINWGDGTAVYAGTVAVIQGSPGVNTSGTVAGSHTYADNGTYTVTVTVSDDDSGTTSKTFIVTVANVAPNVTQAPNQTVNEGSLVDLTGATKVATFTDPGFTRAVSGTVETFTATIDWGDGTGTESGSVSVTQGSAGVLTAGTVSGSHTYADNGTYTVTVTAVDDDSGSMTKTFTVTVNNVAPSVTPAPDQTISEGALLDLTGAAKVATFSDPGFTRAAAGTQETFTATINWGDGGAAQNGTVSVTQGSPGVLTSGTVAGSHSYQNQGVYAVTVTVNDDDSGTTTKTFTVTVTNTAPTVTVPNLTGDENQSRTLTASFTDPGTLDTHTATIFWGDGTSSTGTVSESNGSGTVTASHIYADNFRPDPFNYAIRVDVTDISGAAGSGTGTATIANVAPSLTARWGTNPTTVNGGTKMAITVTGSFTDPGFNRAANPNSTPPFPGTVETFTVTMNWGDGTTETVTATVAQGSAGVLTTGTFTASHVYAGGAVYTSTATVTDDDGGSASASFTYGVACMHIAVVPTINLKSEGVIPVKIFCHTPGFDLDQINLESVRFGPAGALEDHHRFHGAGGDKFLMTHFATQETGIRPWDTVAYLSGRFNNGTVFVGMDAIRLAPPSQAPPPAPNLPGTSKFFVVDAGTNTEYRYSPSGAGTGSFALDRSVALTNAQARKPVDVNPIGIAISPERNLYAMGSTYQIAKHRTDGTLIGTVRTFDLTTPVGIGTDGKDVWIVDAGSKKIFRYGGAGELSDAYSIAVPTSSFSLHADNQNPTGVTTDGQILWVVDNVQDQVFVYNVSGVYEGRWTIDANNSDATDITRSLSDGSQLWILDSVDKKVYKYSGATGLRSGSKSASSTFPLDPANSQPQGIADPMGGGNSPPLAVNDTQSGVQVNVPVNIYVLNNDSDPNFDPLVITSRTTPAHGTATISYNSQYITYTANSSLTSTDTFQYTISDGHGGMASAIVTINASAPNNPPVANADTASNVASGSTVTIYVLSNDSDPNNDPLTVTSVTTPTSGTAAIGGGGSYVTYTAPSNFSGATFQYTASDGHGGTATATVTVNPVPNYPPTANPDTANNVASGSTITIYVLSNDSDPNGDPLTVTSVTTPTSGTVTIGGGGSYVIYTAPSNFNGATFQYTVSDGHGGAASATVTVNPIPNTPPQANADVVNNIQPGIAVTIYVLSNDSDPEGDPLTVTSVTQPSSGIVQIDSSSTTVTFTPGDVFNGGSFQYTISDGHNHTATAAVTLNAAPNYPPMANDDQVNNVVAGSPVTIYVLANDQDPEGDALTITSVMPPSHGTATVNYNGTSITYTPAAGFTGDSFEYTISDGHHQGLMITGTVWLYGGSLGNPYGPYDPGFAGGSVGIESFDWLTGRSSDPAIQSDVPALDIARAMAADDWFIRGAAFESVPGVGRPKAIVDSPITVFPRTGSTFTVLSTGDAAQANDAGVYAANTLGGGHLRGNSDYDVTVLRIDLQVPSDVNYLSFDFQFFTEEYPAYVGGAFNDAFIAELDSSTWTTNNGTITALNNFAVSPQGQPVSLNTAALFGLAPENAIGTAFDGGLTTGAGDPNGAATRLLHATTPITPGEHSLYLSLFNQGDSQLDSAVLVDNLMLGTAATVVSGIRELVTIKASLPATHLPAGTETLLTGQVLGSVPTVTVDGVPVDAFDAAGNFFTRVQVKPGQNTFDIKANPHTSQAVLGTQDWSQFDWTIMDDLSASVEGEYHQTSFDDRPDVIFADVAVHNDGTFLMDTPLLVGVINISEPTIRVRDHDGVTPRGIPFYNFSSLVPDGMLSPGETTGTGTIAFYNPDRIQFTYDLVVLGLLNDPPYFTTPPVVRGLVGKPYVYDSDADDPNHDHPLIYSLLVGPFDPADPIGPHSMHIDALTGVVTWTPDAGDVGNHNVTLRVDDGRGGYGRQRYVVTVEDNVPNRPPYWTSTPITVAFVNFLYQYPGTAADPDQDTLTFSVVSGPDGLTINETTGGVSWVPTADQLGLNDVVLEVADRPVGNPDRLTALQPYTILVQQQLGNHPPVIYTEPETWVHNGVVLHPDSVFTVPGFVGQPMTLSFSWEPPPPPPPCPPEVPNCDPAEVTDGVEFGFYRVQDNQGRVGELLPGDAGYMDAALSSSNRLVIFPYPSAQEGYQTNATFMPGDSYALYVITNGTTDDYLNFLHDPPPPPDPGNVSPPPPQAIFSVPVLNSGQDKLTTAIDATLDRTDLTWTVPVPPGGTTQTTGGESLILFRVARALMLGTRNIYRYPARAIDPDEDPINYSLTTKPQYASIDAQTGDITWLTGVPGAYDFTVRADDGRGGFDTQDFVVTVSTDPGAEIHGRKVAYYASTYCDPIGPPAGGVSVEPITLIEISGAYARPVGMDYYDPMDSVVFSVSSGDAVLNRIRFDGTVRPFSELEGFGDEQKVAIQRPGCSPQFPIGDLFTGNGTDGQIARVTDFGRTLVNPWVDLPDLPNRPGESHGLFRGSLHIDRTSAFGNDLIVVTTLGEAWRINPAGQATSVIPPTGSQYKDVGGNQVEIVRDGKIIWNDSNFAKHLEGVWTVPNLPRYGMFAGKILAGDEAQGRLYVIDPQGNVDYYQIGVAIEDIDLVLENHNFFGANQATQHIWAAASSDFDTLAGEIVLTQEFGGNPSALYRLYWNDPNGGDPADGMPVTEAIPLTPESEAYPGGTAWEHVTFAPAGIMPPGGPGVPHTTYRQGLANWTIYLDTNQNGHRDPGERYTTTDEVGAYSFTELAPGSYVVAEEPQRGREQMLDDQPVPAGIGTHEVTLTNGQVAWSRDFVNRQIVPQPNRRPQFQTSPIETATTGLLYRYNAVAVDPDGDPITYDLPIKPLGMTVEPESGIVVWVPTLEQVGTHDVLLRARDDQGNVTLQYYQINVTLPNTPPVITSRPPGCAAGGSPADPCVSGPASVNYPYRYQVRALDADGDLLEYSLQAAPAGMQIDSSGLLTWTPSAVGSFSVTIQVSDGHGGSDRQSFNVLVPINAANDPPIIQSPPATPAVAGHPYRYAVDASDPNGDVLSFRLDAAPAGMAINPVTGVVSWSPATADIGSHAVAISVHDGRGGVTAQPYSLTVYADAPNDPPVIDSAAPGPGAVNIPYRYPVQAHDPNGDPLAFQLDTGPAGMTMDPVAGVLTWTPTVAGSFPVALSASDGRGGADTQEYVLQVDLFAFFNNDRPQITSSPPNKDTKAGQPYRYPVTAEDPNGDTITFSLMQMPGGMTIDSASGLLTWSSATAGNWPVSIQVSDGRGGGGSQFYTLVVKTNPANDPPTITSAPPAGHAVSGFAYRYQVTATDPNGDLITFALTSPPAGMSIDAQTGRLTWTPGAAGTVTITASDNRGGVSSPQTYDLIVDVAPPNDAPEFDSTPPPGPAGVNLVYQYQVRVHDLNGDPVTLRLATAPAGMSLDDAGLLTWTPTSVQISPPNWSIVIEASDGRGGISTQPFTLSVQSAPANRNPSITSEFPSPAVAGLEFRYQVTATDPDGDPLSYSLTVAPAGMRISLLTGLLTWAPPTFGTFPVTIQVSDRRGGFDTQPYNLVVVDGGVNSPPVITSRPRTRIQFGRQYLYLIVASDPNGDPLEYTLQGAPTGMTLTTDHVISWTPTAAQLGDHAVSVRVSDGRGEFDVQNWTISVVSEDTNSPPQIISTPPASAVVGRTYAYDAQATDPDNDPIVWAIMAGPVGATIDQITGQLRWVPRSDQIGVQDFEVRALDVQGGKDTQTFTVFVRAVNSPSVITSTPPTQANVGTQYVYPVRATDADGDPLEFSLQAAPSGMSIDPVTGRVTWTPTEAQASPPVANVSVLVTDGYGGEAEQSYQIVVSSNPGNLPPVIDSVPPLVASALEPYTYFVTAFDPEGQQLTFTLPCSTGVPPVCPPAGMSIDPATGIVRWTPTVAQQNQYHTITIVATDPAGLKASQRYQVYVRDVNLPPSVYSQPVTQVTAGLTYRYDVKATDPNLDPLTYAVQTGPAAMTIDRYGRITWPTTAADVDSDKTDSDNDPYPVEILVSDDRGKSFLHPFQVTVLPDTFAPAIDLFIDPNPADPGDEVIFIVSANDNVAVTERTLTWRPRDAFGVCIGTPTPLPLDSKGIAKTSFSQFGSYCIDATARDAAGNSTSTSDTLVIRDTSQAPVLSVTAPSAGAIITSPTDINGSVSDPDNDLASWTLSVAPINTDAFRTIRAVTCSLTPDLCPLTPGSVLAQLDPTILANGPWTIRLSAVDTGGHANETSVTVTVDGRLKLGNFTVSFTDLSVPVAGIPITFTPTYDTLKADQCEPTTGDSALGTGLLAGAGILGCGWSLAIQDVDLEVDRYTLGRDSLGFGAYNPCHPSRNLCLKVA